MPKKHIVLGIVAHVDAGKTSLAEALLYKTGQVRQLGRVDQGSSLLDPSQLEKQRKITIYSHQALLTSGDLSITLLDTPGHLDFGQQTEQVVSVLDYAILVISGTAGVQATTLAFWNLLKHYQVPTFIFINQLDRPTADLQTVLKQLQTQLSPACLHFEHPNLDDVAAQDDAALTEFITTETLQDQTIRNLIKDRKIFPCYAGSALQLTGIDELLAGLEKWTMPLKTRPDFGARVFKISHDPQGQRLTWLKVTGGALQAKQELAGEKAAELRQYNGTKFKTVQSVPAGQTCAVTGLKQTYPGQGLGSEHDLPQPQLQPALSYAVQVDPSQIHACLTAMQTLADEDPLLHVQFDRHLQEIRVNLMGQVQLEVLQKRLADQFNLAVQFNHGQVLYQETITQMGEGIGHFEPLRHYAEVHLLLEPSQRGSGLSFASQLATDLLPKNWQEQILTALQAKEHRGVLIGAPLTDVKLTLIAGKGSNVHSVGGDFRQATWRAVRQGLMELKQRGACQLLEPVYHYQLLVPAEQVGRAISDLETMKASFNLGKSGSNYQMITGTAPVSQMRDYAQTVRTYSRGCGQLTVTPAGYRPCANADEVIAAANYDPVADLENSPGSIFCAHGAGYNVRWDQVPAMAHVQVKK
ncbi:MAG: TetM/TetW/TetO/TetS family tetracycline resistance ribosomal protection protein [Lactobacillus sp.]|jgi:small GTP-binding protein|nr:TetM/TetW/TetO/TetS family tetracycline resistance ribosomal protection protein [Lactobacillus sp.]MCH3906183.1 TetM/TetW/TetO/TetS family tetracycline resistance ribosomal protection protein [Lactobacillus sp.]MCH3990240.1 TetM/TetW/TetO/TetS family tetracycline resistance ribosomal protection protein [Lactobacillus sp.]MCH4069046.1 TetM/TetW/TetO/TetS family tetracycline resistance ribosomal protection protein [Lactobacillus sp.]MCI1303448.1 TetM/TetW/TetO/TetS family tetracycline resistan